MFQRTARTPRRHARRRRLLLLLALTASRPAIAQQVDAVGDLRVEASPGGTVTLAYRIANPDPFTLPLTPEVGLPQTWALLTGGAPFTVGPGGTEVQLVTIALPATATAGIYDLSYGVHAAARDAAVNSPARQVVVSEINALRLVLIEGPKQVLAAEPFEVIFRLTNESNRRHTVGLDVRQSTEMPLDWGPREMTLAAGESALVRVAVETSSRLTAELRHRVLVAASIATEPPVQVNASTEVLVLPSHTTPTARWHRLAGWLTLRALAEHTWEAGSRSLPNATLSLDGDLDDEGRRHLELFLQGPEVGGPGPLRTLREEFYARFTGPALQVVAGDFDPTPSRMVTHFRGRGASVRFGPGAWGLGARYQETPRGTSVRIEERAVHGEAELGRHAGRLEYVERWEPETAQRSEILDLGALLRPLAQLSLRLGLAYGRRVGRGAEPAAGLGGEIEILGERPKWSYNVVYLHGDEGFPGQYAGRSALYGGVNAELTERWSAQSSARRGRVREEPDVLYTVPPVETEYVNGLYYRLPRGTTFSLERFARDREEESELAAVSLSEATYRLGVRQDLAKGNVALRVESGEGDDRLAGTRFDLERYTLQAGYRPSRALDLQAELEQSRETALDGGREEALSTLLRAEVQLSDELALSAYHRLREREFRTDGSTSYTSLRLARELPRAHQVALELVHTRTSRPESRDERAMVLEYAVPLSLPLKRRTTAGSIHGRVRSEQDGRPLAGVLVRVGGAVARTGSDGSFSIAAVEAGSQPVVLDTARLGYRQLSSAANPEVVSVAGGGEQGLDLWITAAAVVHGTVRRETSDAERWSAADQPLSEASAEATLPVAGVVLELSDGHTMVRRLTYADGRFVFDPVRPGSWTLRVLGPLPAGFTAELGERTIEVRAGAEIEAPVRLVAERARQRRIPADRDATIEVIGVSASGK